MLAAVRVVAAGQALLAPAVTRKLIGEFARIPARPVVRGLDGVTERERGAHADRPRPVEHRVAAHLHLSMATVKTHIGRLLTKLDARDRAQLVIAAYERPRHRGAGPRP